MLLNFGKIYNNAPASADLFARCEKFLSNGIIKAKAINRQSY